MIGENTKENTENTFQSNKEFPSELNYAQSRFSVDVLIWNAKADEHTIGWFDFLNMKWCFLCKEVQGEFFWRYFNDKIDKK